MMFISYCHDGEGHGGAAIHQSAKDCHDKFDLDYVPLNLRTSDAAALPIWPR